MSNKKTDSTKLYSSTLITIERRILPAKKLRYAISFIAMVLCFYSFMLIASFAISIYVVDEAFYVSTSSKIYAAGCQSGKASKTNNPLNIIDFYYNMDYWLASYRFKLPAADEKSCFQIILSSIINSKKGTSVVFVDNDNKVILKLKK